MMDPKRIVLCTAAAALALAVLPALASAAPYCAKPATMTNASTSHMGTRHEMMMHHGKLLVKNAKAGTFTLACRNCPKHKVYTAPAGTKIASLAGEHVRVRLDSAGEVTAIHGPGAAHAEAMHHGKTRKN
jgi:hypothetical protein